MKKIMILGGGENQIPLLEAATKENYCVVLCDGNSNPAGKKYAKIFYHVDISDRNKVLAVAVSEQINGIISNSEFAMKTVAFVSSQLGLVGNSLESIETLMSKERFRSFQNKMGMYTPRNRSFDCLEEFLDYAESMKIPFIIKPVECSGSRGTSLIEAYDRDALIEAFYNNIRYSRNARCAIEEYVQMPSLNVIDGDIFICNKEILWDGMFLSVRSKESPMIPMIQSYPLAIPEEQMNIVKKTLSDVFAQLGIKHGEFNVELYFTKDNQLFIIEINARQGGNGIPRSIQKYCGLDMYKLLVTTSMGDYSYFNTALKENRKLKILSRYPVFSNKNGTYKGLHIDDEVKRFVDVVEEEKTIGQYIYKRENAESVICFVDLIFENTTEQEHYCNDIERFIYPMVE